jgi:hypothetical protein
MFGIPDPAIWIGYLLALGFTLGCMGYGLLNWNNGVGEEEDGS